MKKNQAIFIIGSPGSGKDVVIRDIASNYNIVEFTSSQIDEMLSNDPAFKRAKPEKQDALLERSSILVTANSYDLNFTTTKQVLESVGYTSHLIYVEANFGTAVTRLKERKNLVECLEKINIGVDNRKSIMESFTSSVVVDNSDTLDLAEQRDFVFSILSDFKFDSEITLEDIENKVSKFKKKVQKQVVPDMFDARGEQLPYTESMESPSLETPTWGTPIDTDNTPSKGSVRNVLNKTKKILFKHKVIPKAI